MDRMRTLLPLVLFNMVQTAPLTPAPAPPCAGFGHQLVTLNLGTTPVIQLCDKIGNCVNRMVESEQLRTCSIIGQPCLGGTVCAGFYTFTVNGVPSTEGPQRYCANPITKDPVPPGLNCDNADLSLPLYVPPHAAAPPPAAASPPVVVPSVSGSAPSSGSSTVQDLVPAPSPNCPGVGTKIVSVILGNTPVVQFCDVRGDCINRLVESEQLRACSIIGSPCVGGTVCSGFYTLTADGVPSTEGPQRYCAHTLTKNPVPQGLNCYNADLAIPIPEPQPALPDLPPPVAVASPPVVPPSVAVASPAIAPPAVVIASPVAKPSSVAAASPAVVPPTNSISSGTHTLVPVPSPECMGATTKIVAVKLGTTPVAQFCDVRGDCINRLIESEQLKTCSIIGTACVGGTVCSGFYTLTVDDVPSAEGQQRYCAHVVTKNPVPQGLNCYNADLAIPIPVPQSALPDLPPPVAGASPAAVPPPVVVASPAAVPLPAGIPPTDLAPSGIHTLVPVPSPDCTGVTAKIVAVKLGTIPVAQFCDVRGDCINRLVESEQLRTCSVLGATCVGGAVCSGFYTLSVDDVPSAEGPQRYCAHAVTKNPVPQNLNCYNADLAIPILIQQPALSPPVATSVVAPRPVVLPYALQPAPSSGLSSPQALVPAPSSLCTGLHTSRVAVNLGTTPVAQFCDAHGDCANRLIESEQLITCTVIGTPCYGGTVCSGFYTITVNDVPSPEGPQRYCAHPTTKNPVPQGLNCDNADIPVG